MMNKFFTVLVIALGVSTAQASVVSYESIEKFHNKRISAIEKEYNLKDRIKITYSLSPILNKTKDGKEIINLPGLMLDSISLNAMRREVGLVEIIEDLKTYKRKIIFSKIPSVKSDELEQVQEAVKNELFFGSKENFVVKNWSGVGGLDKFKESMYSNVLMSPKVYLGVFAFLIIASYSIGSS